MKNKKTIIGVGIIVIVIIILLLFRDDSGTLKNSEINPYNDFAQCITDSGAKLYCADWAAQCGEQKKVFGEDAKFLTYIECSSPDSRKRNAQCKKDNIEKYPTWEFADGKRIEDLLSFDELEKETGCKAPAGSNFE